MWVVGTKERSVSWRTWRAAQHAASQYGRLSRPARAKRQCWHFHLPIQMVSEAWYLASCLMPWSWVLLGTRAVRQLRLIRLCNETEDSMQMAMIYWAKSVNIIKRDGEFLSASTPRGKVVHYLCPNIRITVRSWLSVYLDSSYSFRPVAVPFSILSPPFSSSLHLSFILFYSLLFSSILF